MLQEGSSESGAEAEIEKQEEEGLGGQDTKKEIHSERQSREEHTSHRGKEGENTVQSRSQEVLAEDSDSRLKGEGET